MYIWSWNAFLSLTTAHYLWTNTGSWQFFILPTILYIGCFSFSFTKIMYQWLYCFESDKKNSVGSGVTTFQRGIVLGLTLNIVFFHLKSRIARTMAGPCLPVLVRLHLKKCLTPQTDALRAGVWLVWCRIQANSTKIEKGWRQTI